MLQNLKVDIVYYKTNTDFEMEFNLCGCCRMRLLTDKASDKKTLVHDLARAVSRSRVIIIAGELSGGEGIIEITAKSIAKTLTEIDKNLYGIKTEESISVINGATPLVTSDGEFGGCIIESGPQSMILLSDNREIRKTVMQTLIHPYIEELCTLELKTKSAEKSEPEEVAIAAPPEPQTDDALIETEESPCGETETLNEEETELLTATETADDNTYTEDAEDKADEVAEIQEKDEAEEKTAMPLSSFSDKADDVILEGGMIFETDESVSAENTQSAEQDAGLFIEPKKLKKSRAEYYNRSYAFEMNGDMQYRAPNKNAERRKSGFSGNLPILIVSIMLLIVLAVLCYCIFYVPTREGITASAYLHEIFDTLFV
ncbi:MAG: hypothetical protein UHO61_05290 [Acutalibacteraceae bacterium]|nr:hypothetical protein [Acutalibacteraceae bacterium]